MNIFLAFPFAGICDPKTGEVSTEFRAFFESLKVMVSSRGHTYFLAHEREDWGALYKGPLECTPADFQGVKDCDFLIVVPSISGGVHVELGWASALKKDMHIFLEEGRTYSPVVHGLSALTNVTYHKTSEFPSDEMLQMISDAIKQEEAKRA
jgi:hypothetical protein